MQTLAVQNSSPEIPMAVALFGAPAPLMQPLENVSEYLQTRKPVMDCLEEDWLLQSLPTHVRHETKALCKACFTMLVRIKKMSVQAACRGVLQSFREWNWNLKTFRAKFDLWRQRKDWIVLVNLSKAGIKWQQRNIGLSEAFLTLCETRAGEFGRSDGLRQAIFSLHRQWKTGRNHFGLEQPVAGYETDWELRQREILPTGWTYENISRRLKKRGRLTRGVRAFLHEGESAARAHLPQIIGTNRDMRFMEEITFDDLRFDYLILNEETGKAEELWALIARESSCRLVLGGVLHPASVRADGTASHLGARQMKELAGYLVQTYPLPPYPVWWKVERGTATIQSAVKLALAELFDNRIKVSYTSMIGGTSAAGYKEKKKGNSRGKGSHESHNRLYHTQGCFIPGQTGSHYEIRPADLNARCAEAEQIWQQTRALPEHLRAQVQYPLLTLRQARAYFNKFSLEQNFRTYHKIEGFDEVIEFFDGQKWQMSISSTTNEAGKMVMRQRMESPIERAAKKIREVEAWTRPSPEIICAFLDHSQRNVIVKQNGRITFENEGRALVFEHGGVPLPVETKALAYHHADDPEFIHLTSGDGRFLGTWLQVNRVGFHDRDALARAMRGNHAALEAARATAKELAAPQVEQLETMRAHNEELKKFIAVTDAPRFTNELSANTLAREINFTPKEIKRRVQQKADENREGLRAFLEVPQ